METIIIDPGHSGPIEPGAIGPNGTQEATITLQEAEMIAEELQQKGFNVLLTRTGPIDNDGLTWRAEMANDNNAAALISVHCNAAKTPVAEGYEVYTTPGQNESDKLADFVFEEIALAFPDMEPRTDDSDGDSDKEARFTVLTAAECPAILVEMAFISNSREEGFLLNPGFLRRYAQAIAIGVSRFAEVV